MYIYKDKEYSNIEDAAKDLKINVKRLKKYLKELDNNLQKAVEAYNVENAIYVLDGVPFTSKTKLAKELGISSVTLDKIIEECNGSLEKAVEKIKNKKSYTYKNKEYTSMVKLSEATGINRKTLTRIIGNETEVDKIVNEYFLNKTSSRKNSEKSIKSDSIEETESKITETKTTLKEVSEKYNEKSEINEKLEKINEKNKEKDSTNLSEYIYGEIKFKDIDELSNHLKINPKVLSRYIKKSNFNIDRAIFIINIKNTVSKKIEIKNTELTAQDLAIVLGMKYDEVVIYLEQGKNIEEIDAIGRRNNINSMLYVKNTSFEDNIVLLQYCVDNGLNFNYFYNAINNYGKSKTDAMKSLNENDYKVPKSWILEKYGILLKYLMKSKNISYLKIIKEMRKNNISFEYALENYILRKKSKEYKIDYDFTRIFFSLLTLNGISEEEKKSYIEKYAINENELKCIEDSKTKLDSINRIIFLYKFAENIFKNGLSEEKIKNLIELYNITNDEIELLFLELNPKYNIDILSSEDEKKEKLNRYARKWYMLSDKEKVEIGKKFLTPNEILQVTRIANEMSKYIKKDSEKINKDVEYINLAKKAVDNYVEENSVTRNILENNEEQAFREKSFSETSIIEDEKNNIEEIDLNNEYILEENIDSVEEIDEMDYSEDIEEESLFKVCDKAKKDFIQEDEKEKNIINSGHEENNEEEIIQNNNVEDSENKG